MTARLDTGTRLGIADASTRTAQTERAPKLTERDLDANIEAWHLPHMDMQHGLRSRATPPAAAPTAEAPVPTSMWDQEIKSPWLAATVYIVGFLAGLLGGSVWHYVFQVPR